MYELYTLSPLFPGKNEVDQISKIHNVIGTPPQKMLDRILHKNKNIDFDFQQKAGSGLKSKLEKASPEYIDLLQKMLAYDPEARISAYQCIQHNFFKEYRHDREEIASIHLHAKGMSKQALARKLVNISLNECITEINNSQYDIQSQQISQNNSVHNVLNMN